MLAHESVDCRGAAPAGRRDGGDCAETPALIGLTHLQHALFDLHPRLRLDAPQRASLLAELTLLRTRLDECDRSRG